MSTVGSFEAKTKLAELLDKVEAGEIVTIKRRGREVASHSCSAGSGKIRVEFARLLTGSNGSKIAVYQRANVARNR
jgi:hypothetical protein